MSENNVKAKRAEEPNKLNIKKVIVVIIAILMVVMFWFSFKNLFSEEKTKEILAVTKYITVFNDSKWGVIDTKGNVIIEPTYDEIIIIPNENIDLFICTYDVDYNKETYKTKVLNKSGKEILTGYNNIEPIENTDGNSIWYENDILKYEKSGKYGLVNFKGKKITNTEYSNIYALNGTEKSVIIEKDGKMGLVNTVTGEVITEPKYIDITNLTKKHENGYIVKTEDHKYGIIGIDKKVILEPKYDEIKKVAGNNQYVVFSDNKLQIVNGNGDIILDIGFDSVEEINIDDFVIIKDSKYGVISKTGEEVIPAEYEDLKYAFKDYYIAKKDGKYGIISTSEKLEIDCIYESISYVEKANFIIAENSNYKTDIFNNNFEKVLSEIIISEINTDSGYLRIRDNSEYKYYNFKLEEKTNKEILTQNTLFLVKKDGKYGYENSKGELIVDCIYDDAKEQNIYGYCAVKKDGLWGSLKYDGAVMAKTNKNLDEYLYIDFIADWHRDKDLNAYTK